MPKIATLAIATIFALASESAFAQASMAEQQDVQVIESLRNAGSNLSKPHEIDFFLVFGEQSEAMDAATEMEALGYRISTIDASPDATQWQLHATRQMVPAVGTMQQTTRTLEALAEKHGGDYDGWGAAVVE